MEQKNLGFVACVLTQLLKSIKVQEEDRETSPRQLYSCSVTRATNELNIFIQSVLYRTCAFKRILSKAPTDHSETLESLLTSN